MTIIVTAPILALSEESLSADRRVANITQSNPMRSPLLFQLNVDSVRLLINKRQQRSGRSKASAYRDIRTASLAAPGRATVLVARCGQP